VTLTNRSADTLPTPIAIVGLPAVLKCATISSRN
jgi:hypothetical protein